MSTTEPTYRVLDSVRYIGDKYKHLYLAAGIITRVSKDFGGYRIANVYKVKLDYGKELYGYFDDGELERIDSAFEILVLV